MCYEPYLRSDRVKRQNFQPVDIVLGSSTLSRAMNSNVDDVDCRINNVSGND